MLVRSSRVSGEVHVIRGGRSSKHGQPGKILIIRGAVGEKLEASDPQLRVERPPRWVGRAGPRDRGCRGRAETQREDAAMIGAERRLSVRCG